MRGVRRLVAAATRPAPAPTRLESRAHLGEVESKTPQDRLGPAAGTEDGKEDVLRPDRLVSQAAGLLPRFGQGLLGAGAEGAGIDAGCGLGAQSGLASSMSMMGMPSSTA
jgi:hypothetical protein